MPAMLLYLPAMPCPPRPLQPRRQRGAALFVVIVFVMLSMLLALWASRTSLFNELVVSNDADYQRAFEAAQALLQDAELDIRGERADGSACTGSGKVCRMNGVLQFPSEAKDIAPLVNTLASQATRCQDGLCSRRVGRQDFWNYRSDTTISPDADTTAGEVPLEDLTAAGIGARYGEYTGAQAGSSTAPANPILADTGDGRGGWYWIEVIPYYEDTSNLIVGTNSSQLKLNLDVYVVYRITAVAFGRKPGTMAVLQQTYARQRLKD